MNKQFLDDLVNVFTFPGNKIYNDLVAEILLSRFLLPRFIYLFFIYEKIFIFIF